MVRVVAQALIKNTNLIKLLVAKFTFFLMNYMSITILIIETPDHIGYIIIFIKTQSLMIKKKKKRTMLTQMYPHTVQRGQPFYANNEKRPILRTIQN